MAHSQQSNHDRMATSSACPTSHSDDEAGAELDEPPDRIHQPLTFWKMNSFDSENPSKEQGLALSPRSRKASLLTRALLTSPELTSVSDTDAPHLTSDGGLTSPARTSSPSPPLPAALYARLPASQTKDPLFPHLIQSQETSALTRPLGIIPTQETKVEETLGRKRCISFACGKKALAQDNPAHAVEASEPVNPEPHAAGLPARRPCMLRFVCPMKPATKNPESTGATVIFPNSKQPYTSASRDHIDEVAQPSLKSPDEDNVTNRETTTQRRSSLGAGAQHPASITNDAGDTQRFNRFNVQTSHVTKLPKYASTYNVEDDWTNEQTAYREKMTINDTLQKENAIRRLTEEADQEQALEDEVDPEDDVESVEDDEKYRHLNAASDDGNESDDEGGFAESDDESDNDFDYDFWTPGLTTAATSTDHLDHISAHADRVLSDSSIDAGILKNEPSFYDTIPKSKNRQNFRPQRRHNREQGSYHNLEDFIVGTLDEDRPLQEAYMSSLEQRKKAKQKIIPQDIDPSFPTSDLEADDDGNESEDEFLEENTPQETNEGRGSAFSDRSVREPLHGRKVLPEKRHRNPIPSPKRLRSPPPQRLFGHTSHRLRSPPPSSRWLASPPSSRRPSPTMTPPPAQYTGFDVQHLAQRPNLTRTASLPRTANPFWDLHHSQKAHPFHPSNTPSHAHTDLHTRGPIDIVQGLEKKRQRRQEKFWRLYCMKAHAGKEKERKCQPGKGAERMRELGIQVQDRFKGYGHNRANLMLSI